jgi:hypothetical protein
MRITGVSTNVSSVIRERDGRCGTGYVAASEVDQFAVGGFFWQWWLPDG